MRRALSVIFFVTGGWILASGLMIAGMTFDRAESAGIRLGMMGIMVAMAALPLLLAILLSPGNRLADFGMTLMIVAGCGVALALTTALISHDPGFRQLMPPDRPMPHFAFEPLWGIASVLVVGGGGFLLWRWGLARVGRDRLHGS